MLARYPTTLKAPTFTQTGLLPAVLLCLGLAAIAGEIGLAAIIGAFLAGMVVAETRSTAQVEEAVKPLYAFFPPFFFVFIGLEVDLDALADAGALALLVGVTVLAVITKLVACWIGAPRHGTARSRACRGRHGAARRGRHHRRRHRLQRRRHRRRTVRGDRRHGPSSPRWSQPPALSSA